MPARIVQPQGWVPAKGYANGVLTEGRTLHIGGQIGWNGDQVFETGDFVAQMEQTLANIAAIVEEAGGAVTDIVRLTWFITDKRAYLARQKEVGEAYRRVFGRHFPAMSVVVVAGLIEDEALIEIEATAQIG
ncbi:RidA family protein [Roseibium marinum]|uniref:Enamine deaminase RidA (YjgF/YER057c/UK114 family) n=1 Tax=Roseibium marinum TaxID=281252 RepID=A0A2S3UL90_9HYPH|nr:RidA family protein [Roseibium marinum]POF28239.1 enamine deaminase RidA (YjgF/YER057c/UK114 family) [Roseibium marinum]